ncbi:MAG: TonB-dependent receptor [Hydrogenimonas sp.]|nr:TonB-dependent receptor [Hydrogenimonas sp.]
MDFATGKTVDAPDGPFTLNSVKNRFYRAEYSREDGSNSAKLFYNYSTFNRTQYGGYSGHIKEAGLIDRYDYMDDGFMQAGGGYQGFHQGLSAGADLGKKYANRYIFATNYNRFFEGKTILSESVRYDNYTSFDNKMTYKLGLKHYIVDSLYFAANTSTGYNVPTLYRLYDSWVGNAALKPEKSRGYDLALGYMGFKVLYFSQKTEDLIDYNYSTFKYYNVPGNSEFKGLELSYNGTLLESLIYDLGYTRLFKAEDSIGADLPRRAKDTINYSLTWFPTQKHTVNINGYYVGERYDNAAGTVQTGKYNVTNLSLRHNFAKGYTGEIEIRNLFDRFYQEVDGYATAKRSFYIGISARY